MVRDIPLLRVDKDGRAIKCSTIPFNNPDDEEDSQLLANILDPGNGWRGYLYRCAVIAEELLPPRLAMISKRYTK